MYKKIIWTIIILIIAVAGYLLLSGYRTDSQIPLGTTTPSLPKIEAEIVDRIDREGLPRLELKLTSKSSESIIIDKVIDTLPQGGGWSGNLSLMGADENFLDIHFPCNGSHDDTNITTCDFGEGYELLPGESVTLLVSTEVGFHTTIKLPEVIAHGNNTGLEAEVIYINITDSSLSN